MNQEQLTNQLVVALSGINFIEPSLVPGTSIPANLERQILVHANADILSVITKFLRDNAELLPKKEAVISAVNSAVDAVLTATGRPVITALLKPAVKKLLADAVGALYDAILIPSTEV